MSEPDSSPKTVPEGKPHFSDLLYFIGIHVESENFCQDILYHQTDRSIFKFFPVKYIFGIHKNFAS